MSHSAIAPSSAKTWGAENGCPGSVRMKRDLPEREKSEPAMDGTTCHEVGEIMLLNAIGGPADHSPVPEVGSIVLDRPVTKGMIEASGMYSAHCASKLQEATAGWPLEKPEYLGVEAKLAAPRVHAQSFGTVDFYVANPATNHIFIADLKFGFGVVEVFENLQLINYFAGVADKLGVPLDGGNVMVTFCIVQPRAYHIDGPIREWTVSAAELVPFINQLREGASIALGEQAFTRSGDHCRYCEARGTCPAALAAGVALFEAVRGASSLEMSAEATGVQLAMLQRAQKQIEYLVSGYEEEVKSKIRSGKIVPNYTMVHSKGRENWSAKAEDIIDIGDYLDLDLRKIDVITPAAARKLGVPEDLMKAYSGRNNSSKLKLDNGDRARQIFSK